LTLGSGRYQNRTVIKRPLIAQSGAVTGLIMTGGMMSTATHTSRSWDLLDDWEKYSHYYHTVVMPTKRDYYTIHIDVEQIRRGAEYARLNRLLRDGTE